MRTLTPIASACHVLVLASAVLVTHAGCDATVRTATREAKSLAYVGQIELSKPMKDDRHVVVPLKYIGGQWGQNSAIVPVDVKATVKDMEIDITVVTSVATNTNAMDGDKLVLPKDIKGKYKVYYLDPDGTRHEIGEVDITD